MKNLFKIVAGLFLSLSIASCSKSDPVTPYTAAADTVVMYKATLSGTNESTPNASTAVGTGMLSFNSTTKIFTLTVTHTLATASMGHIHKGAVGVAGGVIFPLGSGTITSPISFTSPVLDATQQSDLLANLYYVNIHSTAFPGGEIRGQLLQQTSSSTSGTGY